MGIEWRAVWRICILNSGCEGLNSTLRYLFSVLLLSCKIPVSKLLLLRGSDYTLILFAQSNQLFPPNNKNLGIIYACNQEGVRELTAQPAVTITLNYWLGFPFVSHPSAWHAIWKWTNIIKLPYLHLPSWQKYPLVWGLLIQGWTKQLWPPETFWIFQMGGGSYPRNCQFLQCYFCQSLWNNKSENISPPQF